MRREGSRGRYELGQRGMGNERANAMREESGAMAMDCERVCIAGE